MTAEIPLLAPGETRPRTFYNLHGDWFGWGCVAIAGIVLILESPPTCEAFGAD